LRDRAAAHVKAGVDNDRGVAPRQGVAVSQWSLWGGELCGLRRGRPKVADDEAQVLADVLGADALGVLLELDRRVHADARRDPLE
jgi:hypothetical protein